MLKTVVDETTRLAMLKRGEIDIAYAFRGVTAEEIRRTQGLTLKPSDTTGLHWFLFSEQWDPKSLWADRRVRLAVNHAIDRDAINQSLLLGFARMTGGIIPHGFEYALPIPPYAYDPAKAKQLLAEAGHPNGFDAGEIAADANFTEIAESAANYLVAVGIRTKVRSYERAAHLNGLGEKKYRGIVYLSSGAYGSTATRLDAFVAAGGLFTYGTYPDIEGLIREQAVERDPKRREATLHRIQQLMHERVMFAPIWGLAVLNAHGSRVADPALGLVAGHQFSAPYEELRLKGR